MSSKGKSFTHLHTHTEYSMLDGAARIGDLVKAAVEDGQPALGITDHGNMYGVLDFYKACKKEGINPIIGTEAYMAGESRFERPVRKGKASDDGGGDTDGGNKLYYHLTLLAETTQGYKNLLKLSSAAFLEGYYYKPRVDWELLEQYHEGIIATTGCLGGVVLQALLAGNEEEALKRAARLQDIFGKDNLFVELQDHGLPEQIRTNPQLIRIADKIGAPLIATNDSHYTHRQDAEAHDALLCVQTGSLLSDTNRFKFDSDEHYLKTAEEMRYLFREVETACDSTLWIAERANIELELGKPALPEFPVPEEFTGEVYTERAAKYLRHLTYEGAKRRYGDSLPDVVVERIDYELEVIANMGFSAYFLVVWDLIRHAEEVGIRVGPGRGSAAGCCVAYCLGIVNLDPIKYDLLFERFLNPGRIQMPDIDMDFDERRRGEMIKYAAERYGSDHVAQIITFSTIRARAAVRDAARVLGFGFLEGDKVAKAMPPVVMGRDTPLYACLEETPGHEDGYRAAQEVRSLYETDQASRKIIDVASGLEGLRRGDGIHAAAVVISHLPLTEYLPIQRKPGSDGKIENAPIVTQFEMHDVEELGLLKMDFLGLRNLSIIERCLDMVEAETGVRPDIDNVPLDDAGVYELLQRSDTVGVFQLEGRQMRALMRSLAPTEFGDIAALVALYRPGPMAANMHNDYADRKNGRKKIEYQHPDLEPILRDTYGLMIYQESVMRVAQKFAGYSLAEADNLRKACLPEGTLMLTKSRGYVPIEKIMSLSNREVQTIDVTSANSRYGEVADVWPVGVKPVYRLTTSTGYSVRATEDHKVLVEGEWTQLKDISKGDLVAVASRTTTHGGAKLTKTEAELSALLISEGYIPDVENGQRRHCHFTNTDPELLDIYSSAFEDFFGRPPRHQYVNNGVTQMYITADEILNLKSIIGTLGLSGDKSIPDRVVNAPMISVERFLGLYFCADGWADKGGIHFGSKSKDVCLAIKRMLLRAGIVSNLLSRDLGKYGVHWTLSVADKNQAKAFIALVEPHLTQMKVEKVAKWLGVWESKGSATNFGIPTSFVAEEIERRVEVTGRSRLQLGIDGSTLLKTRVLHRNTLEDLIYSERLEDLRTGDLIWDSVVSIEYEGDLPCYDFEMEDQARPYALADDVLVHNCGKKDRVLIAKERMKFVAGCEETGYGEKLGNELFDVIEPFADYAFNKSHSYGYGFVAYQTAWLKVHYPVEYMAALLTSVKDDKEKTAVYLSECRAMGIEVLVPDVNASYAEFTPRRDPNKGPGIVFGLAAVRNVGEGLVEKIVAERNADGPFKDFYDFCRRVDTTVLNKRTIESLVKAGAFDSLGHPRMGLNLVANDIIEKTVTLRKEYDVGVVSLFAAAAESRGDTDAAFAEARLPIPNNEFEKTARLTFEKEMLGLYVSDHPLRGLEKSLIEKTDTTISEIREMAENDDPALKGADAAIVSVGGVITDLSRRYTKKGDQMATFTLEDLDNAIEVVVFPRTLPVVDAMLESDAIVIVKGRVDVRDDTPKLIVMEVSKPSLTISDPNELRIRLAADVSDGELANIKRVLLANPGNVPVRIKIGDKIYNLPPKYNVSHIEAMAQLRGFLAPQLLSLA